MNESEADTMQRLLDDDDAPAWSDEVFERVEVRDGDLVLRPATGTLAKRGRPKAKATKRQVTLRLDGDVLDHFRAGGPGWQSRINAVLKKTVTA